MRSPTDQRALGGRYVTRELLETGSQVETWLGIDLLSGQQVIIKRTPSGQVSLGAQLRLEHEGEVLRELSSPSLAAPLALGREGDVFYLVQPRVPGPTLAARLAERGPLPVDDALAVGQALMQALQTAHERGVLHRAVRPANLAVGQGSPPGRVVLFDFGLARCADLEAALRDCTARDLAYVSPEQAGLIHNEVGERSDLYSAGILLFECLSGRLPFDGDTIGDILRRHLTAPPPRLPALRRCVPRALDEVVRRLLEKDPRDRYQSAAAVRADLESIAKALAAGAREPSVAIGAFDRRRTLTEPAFVGRDDELRALEQALASDASAPALLLLEGTSGSGKTRLLDELALRAAQRGVSVLRGQGTDRPAQRPLQALDSVLAHSVRAAETDAAFAGSLRSRLGDQLAALAPVLPELADRLAPGRCESLGPEAHGERRTLAALVALLAALGSPEQPLVILLDDCQWLDELSLRLLLEWQRAHALSPGPRWVRVVAAFRGEEVASESPLRGLVPAPTRLELGPLTAGELRTMAESMAGPLPAQALPLLERLSGGNPFLAAAVLEGLVEGGALVATNRGWELEPHAMAQAQSSRRAAALLARRLETLSSEALRILSVGAVLGKSFDLQLAAKLCRQSAAQAMAGATAARRKHFLWADASGSRFTFVHDRIREAVLERFPSAERRRLHSLAADALLCLGPPDDNREFDLAYHFDAAGEPARALPHALTAAAQARSRHALEMAERLYRMAERGAAQAGSQTRQQVAEELGDVLLLRGRYGEAREAFSQARALAASAVPRARVEGKLGELAFKQGDVRAAAQSLERSLRLLGRHVPKSPLATAAAALEQALVQAAHSLLPRQLVGRRRLEDAEADLLAARLFSRLAYANWFLRGQVATFWAHLSELNLAERYPPTRELAQACSEHAISVTGLPRFLFRRGARYAERGLAIRRALGDLWGQGQSLNFHGMLLYAFGYYEEALGKFRDALAVLRRTGDRWEADVAWLHVALCLLRLGALKEAAAECQRLYREARAIGDGHASEGVLEIWAKATGGALPKEPIEAALRSSEGDPQTHEAVLQAEGLRLIAAGRPREAAAAFARAEAVVRSVNLKNEYVSYPPLWTAHALRLAALKAGQATGAFAPRSLRQAHAALRRGLPLARRYRGNLPLALRERAWLRAMRGRAKAARRDLDASLAEAERQGAVFEAAQTRLARGELGLVYGWPGAEKEAARARSALHELGADFAVSPLRMLSARREPPAATLSLADRFASIVHQGRRIASALTPGDVWTALREAAEVLLRGDATLVLELEADGPLSGKSYAGWQGFGASDPGLRTPGGSPTRAPWERVLPEARGPEPEAPGKPDGFLAPRALAESGGRPLVNLLLVERAVRDRRPVALADLLEAPASEGIASEGPRSALCAPILARGRPVACLYVAHARVSELFSEEEKQLAGYLVTLAGASLEKAEGFAALQALSLTLEQRVVERTEQLRAANAELEANLRRLRETQEQLVQAARMAAVGTLVAGLSHEINNPLAVILAYAQSHLKRLPPGDPMRPGLSAIERQAKRAADLVGTLLDFSRKKSGDREKMPLEALVQRVVTLESPKMRSRDVKLELALPPPGAIMLRVSPTQIESALLNLVDNAADASARGSVVRIEAKPTELESRPGVEVRVSDRGSGIGPEVLPRVFDPFFTTKPLGQGTGLGLSLTRQFVEGNDGTVSIDSQPGEGTTVRLWFPLGERTGERVQP
jgi:signal transduction histidine kinase/tetratricopeptide (TPR) repeat protein